MTQAAIRGKISLMKQYFVISLFFILVLASFGLGFLIKVSDESGNLKDEKEYYYLQKFVKAQYFYRAPGDNDLYFAANQIYFDSSRDVLFELPQGFVVDDKLGSLIFKSKRAKLLKSARVVEFQDQISFSSSQFQLSSTQGIYQMDPGIFNGTYEIKSKVIDEKSSDVVEVESQKITMYLKERKALYENKVVGAVKRKRKFDGNFNFSSDQFLLDWNNSYANLNRNVVLKDRQFLIKSHRADIFLENFNKKLKYYVFYDDVSLKQSYRDIKNQLMERSAFAEKMEGFAFEKKFVLSGAPKVVQGRDMIKGNQITIYQNSNLVEINDSAANFIYEGKK